MMQWHVYSSDPSARYEAHGAHVLSDVEFGELFGAAGDDKP